MDLQSALEKMRRDFGPEVFRNPKRMVAILRDLAPGLEAESNTLRQIAERGLFAELEQASHEDDTRRGRVMMKLQTCLTDYLQLSEERTAYYTALLLDLYDLPHGLALTTGRQGNLSWTLDENGLLTLSGAGAMRNYEFASDTVNSPWWERRTEIISLRVLDGVTAIGDSAFYGCNALEKASLPDSVVRIGEWAFADCARLDGVTLPPHLRRMDRGAFSDCKSLSEIDIPDGVTSIESWTFCHCLHLRRVTIPESVVNIGQRAFQGCALLSHVQIPAAARVENAAFDTTVALTRPAPPAPADAPDAPRWTPIGLPSWLTRETCRTLLFLLFALTVILRHGFLTLPLLFVPVGLLLFRKEL